ncbi:MAG: glycosyltransferase family 4 protein [Lachnospiraceae bacterium]|nr:glycosyltransferase family 4 protein [Lachnospiraceae bacterium]
MNLLIVHNHYRLPGGEDTVVQNEYRLLKSMGHDVTLYERDNKELDTMTGFKRLRVPFGFIYSKKTAKDITAIIKEKSIAVVMVHNTLTLISPSVYYAAARAGVPIIQTVHNFRLICPGALLYRDGRICEDCLKKGLHCALKHRCYRNSFTQTLLCVISSRIHRKTGIYGRLHYICLTEFNKEKLKNLPGIREENIFVKPNFTAMSEEIIPYAERDNTFIYAGRLEEIKGTGELLEAWYLLETKAKTPEEVPTLDLYGSGPMTETVRRFIENHGLKRVILHEPLPHEDIIKTIARARALILPTKWYEGFPMTITESFSVGTPVIGTDLGNTGDLIRGNLGALISPDDMQGSIAHIIEAWDTFAYDESAFRAAATAYGEAENKRLFTEILTRVTQQS